MTDQLLLLIDGKHVPAAGNQVFAVRSPATGDHVAEAASADVADADRAVSAAWRAFAQWSRTSYVERRRVLLRAADLLEQHAAEHCAALTVETGAVRGWAEMNVAEAAATLREAAALTSRPVGSVLPSHDPNTTNLDLRLPAGVVLAMVPWNAPVVLSARAVAIAVAAGNTVILRPSERAPYTSGHLLADVLTAAGLPDGVVNVLTCSPAASPAVVEAVIARREVRRVVFIGSTPVGRAIATVAGRHLTPAVLELGGKNVTVVMDDADLDRAADAITTAAFANSGQVCMSTDLVLVPERHYPALAANVSARARALPVGDPRDPATAIGPLISAESATRWHDLVTDAVHHGAELLTGGNAHGQLAEPTVLCGLPAAARLRTEEAFGPLVALQAYSSEDELIAIANGTDYGLIASVLGADTDRARRVALRINAGAVHINGPSVGDEPHVPFGGVASSGSGRLGGTESWHFFTEQKTLYVH
jgi:acyl-CoA reductase-like NAD-dependent aldehyde dehydrogenase